MQREDVQRALEAACGLTMHSEFVIAGSLSVLGLINTPPERMSLSIDIDFYPLRDPGRASEIASVLGEDSEFHEQNGYYLDAVSPLLPLLPDGWKDRLVKVELGLATAYFLEVHDAAISKYARGAENDYQWIEAGYKANILDIALIMNRVRFETTYFDDEDRRKTNNGLLMHKTAMQSDGLFANDLLHYFQCSPPQQKIKEIDLDRSEFSGKILWVGEKHAVQSLGRGDVAIHNVENWLSKPRPDNLCIVRYRDGTATLKTPEHVRGSSVGI